MSQLRILLVPGRSVALPGHWQSRWARANPQYQLVPRPEDPTATATHAAAADLEARVGLLHDAITTDPTPKVLVAHSLGCIVTAHWAGRYTGPVRAALLVAPPYMDAQWPLPPDGSWLGQPPGAHPRAPLPFRTILVASHNDPNSEYAQSQEYARAWGAELVDAGDAGHLGTADGYGPWPHGEQILAELVHHVLTVRHAGAPALVQRDEGGEPA